MPRTNAFGDKGKQAIKVIIGSARRKLKRNASAARICGRSAGAEFYNLCELMAMAEKNANLNTEDLQIDQVF